VESQKRAAVAWEEGRFKKSIVPVKDIIGLTLLDHDEHMRPDDDDAVARQALKASFEMLGDEAGFDNVLMQRYPEVERINHVHHAGNSSGIVDGAAGILIGTKEAGERRA
jgi:acetyl-CoA C-acetyltransferase